MTAADRARENPLGALFAVAAGLAWLVVVAAAAGLFAQSTGAFLRLLALAVVLTGFAVGFGARTVGERHR